MSWKGFVIIFVLYAFSFMILDPSLAVLPAWVVDNVELYALTIIIWQLGFAGAFWKVLKI